MCHIITISLVLMNTLSYQKTRIDVFCVNEWLTRERRGPNETKVQRYGQTTTLLTKRFKAVSTWRRFDILVILSTTHLSSLRQVCCHGDRCVVMETGVLLWRQVCRHGDRCVVRGTGVSSWRQVCCHGDRCVIMKTGVLLWRLIRSPWSFYWLSVSGEITDPTQVVDE